MKKAYDPHAVEEKWYSFWEKNGFFKASSNSKKKPYTIILPPPNITGRLHMGHALANTLQDILIRFKRMQGFEALWIPGVDHAGIATQSVVEKHLFKETGKKRFEFTREEFLKHVFKWKDDHQDHIVHQLKLLASSCDWDRLSFTMDDRSNKTVKKAFKKLFDDGLIYRGDRLVNWDTVLKTAIADDEVEHEEVQASIYYLSYPIQDMQGRTLSIATTRPETMLADVAVAVNPKDSRYKDLIGQKVKLPITNRLIPIIADSYVDPDFGSGAVKITPAHDFNDYEIGMRHDLELINMMNEDGTVIDEFTAFAKLSMQEARAKIVDVLTDLGSLEKIEPHTKRVGVSYRSKAVIEPFLSKQWFIKMEPFKQTLIQTVKEQKVKLLPKVWEKTYFHWIENLRDWCISRQLWWGHRIPVWYDTENEDNVICYIGDDIPQEVKDNPSRYRQEEDVLDTWFSSALWPFSTLDWLNDSKDFNYFYPNSTLVTGYDILFFWVARMIMMGTYLTKKVPFHESFIHGLIFAKSYWTTDAEGQIHYCPPKERDQYELGQKLGPGVDSKWEKMSKSKGNIIDPIAMIKTYGTDAVRFTLAYSMMSTRQIDLDTRKFEEFKNFANKLYNASRFIFLHVDSELDSLEPAQMHTALDHKMFTIDDHYILEKLNDCILQVQHDLENYHFEKASRLLYSFFWDEFCSKYLELCKPYLFDKTSSRAQKMQKKKLLVLCLCSIVRLLHPFTPFITEEIFSDIQARFKSLEKKESSDPMIHDFIQSMKAKACMVSQYPKGHKTAKNTQIIQEFSFLYDVVYAVRNIRAEMQITPRDKSEVLINGPKERITLITQNTHFIQALAPVSAIKSTEQLDTNLSSSIVSDCTVMIPVPKEVREKEKQRIEKVIEKEKAHIQALEKKLSLPNFKEKAPKDLVLATQQKLEAKNQELDLLEKKILKL